MIIYLYMSIVIIYFNISFFYFNGLYFLLKNRLLAQMDDPANLSCMYAFEMAHDKHSISIPVQGSLKDLETLTLDDVKKVYTLYMDMAKHFYICGYVTDELYDYIDSLDSHCAFISERTLLPVAERMAPPVFNTLHKYAVFASICIERDIFIPSNGLSAANSSSSPRRRGILFFTQDIFWCPKGARDISFTSYWFIDLSYSTVTDFARFFGLSILHPLFFAT